MDAARQLKIYLNYSELTSSPLSSSSKRKEAEPVLKPLAKQT